MALPKLLATIKLNFYVEPIDINGTNTDDNVRVIMEPPIINGVQCAPIVDASIDSLNAAAFAYVTNYMTGWGPYDLGIAPAKPLTKRLIDGSLNYRAITIDVDGAYSVENTTFVEENPIIEGYTVPTWVQQNISSSSNFLAISASLRNQVRTAVIIGLPSLLRLADIQRGRATPFTIE